MKAKVLAPLGVAGVLAAALVYWFGFRDDPRAATKPATEAKDPWAAQERPAAKEAPRSGPMPALAFETDPEGPLLLEGQVLDEDDQPVKGATVRITSSPARTATTDDDGTFSFDKLLGRNYTLTARAGDKIGGPVTTKVAAKTEPVVIRLRQGVAVTVLVTDAVSKKPVANASVILFDHGELKQTTGADGTTVFRGIEGGWTRATASAPGYGPSTESKIITAAEKTARLELALRKGAPLMGRVVDEQGKGVAGARVWPTDASNPWEQAGGDQLAVTTAGDGAFTIPALAAGSYVLKAKDESHAPASTAPITVSGEIAHSGVEIVMKSAGSIAGVVVTPDGKPVPYAAVRVSSREWSVDMVYRQAAADDAGKFEVRALPRSPLKLRAESDEAASRPIDVDLAATPVHQNVKLVLDQTGVIAGIVVDEAGEPVAEASVRAYLDWSAGNGDLADFMPGGGTNATTDGGGRFSLRGLQDGQYRISAKRTSGGRTMKAGGEDVVAKVGDKNVRVVLPAPGGITGKIALASGKAPELVMVSTGWAHKVTTRDGAFELLDLAPDKYDLRLVGPDFAEKVVRDVEVKPGKTTDVGTVTVKPGRKIAGKVVDASGRPVEGARVMFGKLLFGDGKQAAASDADTAAQMGIRFVTTDASGSFLISGAPRSGGSLVAEHPEQGRSVAQAIPAAADDLRGLTLALRGYGSIAGKVTRKGQPVAGASVSAAPIGSSGQALFVVAGDDGAFVIDKLPEGPTALSAMKNGMMSMQGGARTITVVAGKRVDASIVIPAGDLALTVKVEPKPNETVNAAQVFLFRGAVTVANGQQLMNAFMANQGVEGAQGDSELAVTGAAGMLFWLGGEQPQPNFKELVAGSYTACVIPVTGSLMDEQLMGRIMRNLDKLAVHCKAATVAPAPAQQAIAVAVPAMSPLPDDEE